MLRSVIQHLRLPFSVLLMPVFLFAMAELNGHQIYIRHAILLFLVLHLLVYPSSNAFNSLQDEDKGSIGLVKKPLPVPDELAWITWVMDALAVALSVMISIGAASGILIYILFSRLYSDRKIRLKKYPVIGFLTVFIFQGFWIYILVQYAVAGIGIKDSYPLAVCASCLIGAMYPLSQIYQHKQDKEDGVTSISYLLGYRGTFLFSGLLFLIGTSIFISMHLVDRNLNVITFFMLGQLPVVLYFLYWFYKVWNDTSEANFKHTMYMNVISSVCMNITFVILFFCKQ